MFGVDHATPGMLVLLVILLFPILYGIHRTKRGATFFVRRIAGIDAVDEATGRSAEIGRPISFTTGLTGLGPVLYACLGVLSYIARRAALYKTKLILPQNQPDVLAVTEDIVRDSYRIEGRAHMFDPNSTVFLSDDQFAFASGYMGTIHRERVGSAFLFGTFAAESLILAEAGQQIGAMQVAGSVSPEQIPFFICACDYTLIGEELYAASAYLTDEPVQLGSLYGQDRSKMIILLTILIGIGIATFNMFNPDSGIPTIDSILLRPW